MTIDVATGIVRILKQEGVAWVSTFPVCRVNNALGREGVQAMCGVERVVPRKIQVSDAR